MTLLLGSVIAIHKEVIMKPIEPKIPSADAESCSDANPRLNALTEEVPESKRADQDTQSDVDCPAKDSHGSTLSNAFQFWVLSRL